MAQLINYTLPNVTSFQTTDYWGSWSKDFQHTHLARMVTLSWLVFLISGTTKKPYVGKLFAAMVVFALSIMWHAAQELSFYGFAVGTSLAPPWIGNYAPQSMAYEVLADLVAIGWALGTSLLLSTPCCYMIEGKTSLKLYKADAAEMEIRDKERAAAAARAQRVSPLAKVKNPAAGFMRAGGSTLIVAFLMPFFIVIVVPLSMYFLTMGAAAVDGAFRVDILIFCLLWLFGTVGYWVVVYLNLWKFGLDADVKASVEKYYRRSALYTLAAHALLLLFCFALCAHPFMSGLEFLQPVYGFAAAIIPSIVFSIVIMRTTKDTTLVALFRDAQHTD
jgi:hypothetical protein